MKGGLTLDLALAMDLRTLDIVGCDASANGWTISFLLQCSRFTSKTQLTRIDNMTEITKNYSHVIHERFPGSVTSIHKPSDNPIQGLHLSRAPVRCTVPDWVVRRDGSRWETHSHRDDS